MQNVAGYFVSQKYLAISSQGRMGKPPSFLNIQKMTYFQGGLSLGKHGAEVLTAFTKVMHGFRLVSAHIELQLPKSHPVNTPQYALCFSQTQKNL